MIAAGEPRTPVTVVTGPGRAGQTALFAHLSRDPALARSVVLTAGVSGLVADSPPEAEAPARLGCVCCTVQGDLQRSLRALLAKARRGEVSHVLVDADARSDPLAVLTTLITDPVLAAVYRIGGIVAVVGSGASLDGEGPVTLGVLGLEHDRAARRLILLADRVIALGGTAVAVRSLNSAALVFEGLPDADFVLQQDRFAPLPPSTDTVVTVTLPDPVDWAGLVHRLGASLLPGSSGCGVQRLFGVLQVAGESRPVAIDSVRHHVAPPSLLPAWPTGSAPHSRLVFMGGGLDDASIQAVLAGLGANADGPVQ